MDDLKKNREMTIPKKVEIITHVEIYSKGNVITYTDYTGFYNYPGGIFGVSVSRVLQAIKDGHAKPSGDEIVNYGNQICA